MSKKFIIALEELAETPTIVEEVPEAGEGDAVVVETSSDEDKVTEISIEKLVIQEQLNIDIQELEEEIAFREEQVDGLTGLKTIAERVGTPTPTDVALFRVAANMAVSGTQEDAKEFIPAIESNKPIQGKSFDSKIKALQGKIDILKLALVKLKAQQKISKEELAEEVPPVDPVTPPAKASEETPVVVPEEGQTIATENWELHLKNKLAVIKKLQSEIPHLKAKIAAEKAKKKK